MGRSLSFVVEVMSMGFLDGFSLRNGMVGGINENEGGQEREHHEVGTCEGGSSSS